MEDTKIGGVHVYVYTPKDGVKPANQNRVLINLHGGGFSGCWPGCAELESRPIVGLGAIKDGELPSHPVITGTRGFEMSGAVYTHSRLVKLGVDAELHVWEGMFHGFFYNPDVPESQDAYAVIVKFFDRDLGTK